MDKIIDDCIRCEDGCRGCGRKHKHIRVCDICEDRIPRYDFDGTLVCEYCLTTELLTDWFLSMTESEQIEALGGRYVDE